MTNSVKLRRVLRNESTEDARRIWDFVEKAAARTKLPRAVKPAGWLYKAHSFQGMQFSPEEPEKPNVYWKTPVYVAEEVDL